MTPESVPNLWKYLDEFQKSMADIHSSLTNPKEKAVLGELLGQLHESRKEVERTVPALIQEMHQKNLGLKAWAEDFLPKIEQQQQELEGKLKAAADAQRAAEEMGVPPKPEAAVAPNLGTALGGELLQRFGRAAEAGKRGPLIDDGSVANAWVEPEAPKDAPPAEEAKTAPEPGRRPKPDTRKLRPTGPAPKKEKEPPKEKDIWEGLSQMES